MEQVGDAGRGVSERDEANGRCKAAQSDLSAAFTQATQSAQGIQRGVDQELDLPSTSTRRHTGRARCAIAWNQDERLGLFSVTPVTAGGTVGTLRSAHGGGFTISL